MELSKLLTKNRLKQMFLKVLYETQYGKMQGHSKGIHSIVPSWINEFYDTELSPDEIQLLQEVIQELRYSGMIANDATQRVEAFLVLTQRGKITVEQQKNPDVYAITLEQVIRNGDLLAKCADSFNNDNYEVAVFAAYRFVEEEVRRKASLDPNFIGESLMTEALHPKRGKLKIPSCKVENEQEGVYNLFKGAIAFFKNPSSHRSVDYDNRLVAFEILCFADLLLQILSTAPAQSLSAT